MREHAKARCLKLLGLGVMIAAGFPAASQAGTIGLRIDPEQAEVNVADTFELDIVADIEDAILAFGLEIDFDSNLFQLDSLSIGPEFLAQIPGDANYLGAIAFPSSVDGEDVVLGTATFTALDIGTGLFAINIDGNSLTQGFAEESIGNFATVNLLGASSVTASLPGGGGGGGNGEIPEPTTLALLAVGGLTLMRRRLH